MFEDIIGRQSEVEGGIVCLWGQDQYKCVGFEGTNQQPFANCKYYDGSLNFLYLGYCTSESEKVVGK